jgi:dGTPase
VNNTFAGIRKYRIDSVTKVRKHKKQLAVFDGKMERMHMDLKKFLFDNMYKHYKVIRMEEKAQATITALFKIYLKWGKGKASILPPNVRRRLKIDPLKRVIADYIAGMTDRGILDEYRKLFDPNEKV